MLYTGDGGNAQRAFILDAQVGWKAILADPQRHLGGSVAQYEYMEGLLNRLGGQARRCLEKFLFRWNWLKPDNPNLADAIDREADRQVWREFYMEKAAYNLGRVHMRIPFPNPIKPDLLAIPIPEPADLEEFLADIKISFQSASASFFDDLRDFRAQPRESLVKLADRFDEVAEPLRSAGLMTTRGLALKLRAHIPAHIRKTTLSAMMKQDMSRFKQNLPLTDKDELLKLAQESETFLLEFETELRAARLTPEPRDTDMGHYAAAPPPRPVHRPMEDRLGAAIRDVRV